VSDFDETLFHTTTVDSPGKMNVRRAYELAIADIFGEDGEYAFKEVTGLHGRTPSELVHDILEWGRNVNSPLIKHAINFYLRERSNVAVFIPEAKNGSLIWNDQNPESTITQMLVGRKLSYLLDEIGQDWTGEMWPRPTKGALEFIRSLVTLRQEGLPLDFAVLSSGHELFIRKSFAVWDLPQPEILVTEDDIRPRKYPEEQETKFKPGPFPIALVHFKWLRRQNVSSDNPSFMTDAMESKKRILCIGDDPRRDSGMAHRANLTHYLYPYTPFIAITDTLRENRYLLDGRPISEIFTQVRNGNEVDILLPDNLEFQYRARGKER
ncbi:MAG: hypothetical protein AAB583_06545, partial [Patescibacteria group bacterium]